MGIQKTEKCFFTGDKIITNEEPNGKCLDGYYYQIVFNDKKEKYDFPMKIGKMIVG